VYQFSSNLNDFGSELPDWNKVLFNLSNVRIHDELLANAFFNFIIILAVQTNNIAIVGLLPGKLLKVAVLPTDNSNVESRVPFTNKAVKTTCGCPRDSNTLRTTEPTGSPTSVSLLQVSTALYLLYFTC
jgi:hypothetical protein